MIQSCCSKRLLVKPTLSCQLTPRPTRFSRRQSLARISYDIVEKWRAECCKRGVRYKRLQTAWLGQAREANGCTPSEPMGCITCDVVGRVCLCVC